MSTDNQLAVSQPPAFLAVANLTGLDAKYLVETVKLQCFKGAATDAQVDAFISIACEMKVNPLLPGMLYAYPISGGGIVPIMGPSGVYKKLVEHPDVASWETEVFPVDVTLAPTHAVTKIWRKGVERPLVYTALLSEWKIESNPNWRSRPRHMLALRSLKHCANQIIHGIPYDEDDRAIMAMTNVTGTGETPAAEQAPAVERAPVRERAKRGAAGAKAETTTVAEDRAQQRGVEVVVTQEEQKAAHQTGAEPKAENIQQAMEARQAKTEAAKVEPAKPVEPAPVPRAFLQDGEKLTVTAKVETMEAVAGTVNGKRFPAVKALLSGGFNGEVRHKDGGARFIYAGDKETGIEALPPWKVGAVLSFNLIGQKSTAASLNGKVLVFVESVSVVGDQGEVME